MASSLVDKLIYFIYNTFAVLFVGVVYVVHVCTHFARPKARNPNVHPRRIPKEIAPLTEHEARVLKRFPELVKMEAVAYYRDYNRNILNKKTYVLYQFRQLCAESSSKEQLMLIAERHDDPYYVGYVGETPFDENESPRDF